MLEEQIVVSALYVDCPDSGKVEHLFRGDRHGRSCFTFSQEVLSLGMIAALSAEVFILV